MRSSVNFKLDIMTFNEDTGVPVLIWALVFYGIKQEVVITVSFTVKLSHSAFCSAYSGEKFFSPTTVRFGSIGWTFPRWALVAASPACVLVLIVFF